MSVTSEAKTEQKTHASLVIAIVGSLSIVFIALITNARPYLEPALFNLIVAGFAVAILGLVAFYFVVRPLSPIIAKWRRGRLHESVAAKLFPELENLVNRFSEIALSNYTIGINQAIRTFQVVSTDVDQAKIQAARGSMELLTGFYHPVIDVRLDALKSDMEWSMRRKPRFFLFRHFLYEFWNLVWVYKLVFVNSYVQTCKRIGEDAVVGNSKEEYVKFLSKYSQFVVAFSELGKKANALVGEALFPYFVEDAIPLKL